MPQDLYQRIYLSPHLDDAALSSGGLIYQERQAGLSVLVLTLMAGDVPPEAMDAPFVARLHARWGLDATLNPAAVRRAEDREALSVLTTDIHHWEWPDCIYRRHAQTGAFLYHSEVTLFGPVHPTEQDLSAQIARRLTDLPLAPGGRVYAPLTVGGHVDHRLVRQAAETWGPPQGELVYYEDYPYAEHSEALATALKDRTGWEAEIVPLEEAALAAKTTAIGHYHSQISTFFASRNEMVTRLRDYAANVSAGQGWAERYWRRK